MRCRSGKRQCILVLTPSVHSCVSSSALPSQVAGPAAPWEGSQPDVLTEGDLACEVREISTPYQRDGPSRKRTGTLPKE